VNYAIDKPRLGIRWLGAAQHRHDALKPTKWNPPDLLLTMAMSKDGPALNAVNQDEAAMRGRAELFDPAVALAVRCRLKGAT
jgi:hypothetical protein